ncbi:SelT/SelW/SelH family protein [Niabella yanshanensis]|uniref:SelT/SelW/SelH family protein n=1 Tax=Niabella yanshanensis TaxID=577386 RepID=A0ABZ0W2W9_9BACT|nr:SelT/SelW/SelH family protein [Niabella yanshanensis]WQD36450.1 SelT/SelW/SelH family protein [Niabella yanshanensis]
MKPTIIIEYCPKCGWMLRAAYMAQEFLTTFGDFIEAVTLKPGTTSGIFVIYVDDQAVFDRKANGGFMEIKELKQLLRDKINPGMSLGHSDKK